MHYSLVGLQFVNAHAPDCGWHPAQAAIRIGRMPSARYKLLGKYRTPTFRYGQRVEDERRGEVRIVGFPAGRIPWPMGQTKRTKSLVLYRDLARAVRRESVVAIGYWWGVGANAVRKWRKALAVQYNNDGTTASRVAHGKSKANRPALAAMHAKAQDSERRAKIGVAHVGKSPANPAR